MPINKKTKKSNAKQIVDSMDDDSRIDMLLTAAKSGDYDMIKYLVEEHNVPINEVSEKENSCQGLSALHAAVRHGQLNCVKFLIDAGADVNKSDKFGFRPAHDAAILGEHESLQLLVDKKAILDGAKDMLNLTPLYYALQQNRKECVEILTRDENNNENAEYMYWDIASKRNNPSIMDISPNVNKPLDSFEEWLYNAALNGNKKFFSRFKDYMQRNLNSRECIRSLVTSTIHDKNDFLQMLLEGGLNPNKCDLNNLTALHYAARYGHESCIETLLKYGANISARCSENYTPLHVAIRQCCIEGLNKLITCGADINEKGGPDDDTPVQIALKLPCEEEIMRRILEEKPNMLLKNKKGETGLTIKSDYELLNDLIQQHVRN